MYFKLVFSFYPIKSARKQNNPNWITSLCFHAGFTYFLAVWSFFIYIIVLDAWQFPLFTAVHLFITIRRLCEEHWISSQSALVPTHSGNMEARQGKTLDSCYYNGRQYLASSALLAKSRMEFGALITRQMFQLFAIKKKSGKIITFGVLGEGIQVLDVILGWGRGGCYSCH